MSSRTIARCRAQGGPNRCADPKCPEKVARFEAFMADFAPDAAPDRQAAAWSTHAELLKKLDEKILLKAGPAAEEAQWVDSPFKSFWDVKNGKRRGAWGEAYFRAVAEGNGVDVQKPTSVENDGVFNGHKLEIKTNASSFTGDRLSVNWAQIRPEQDYEALLGQVVTPNEVVYFLVPKTALLQQIAAGKIPVQHGGVAAQSSNTHVLSTHHVPEWLKPYRRTLPQLWQDLQQV